MLYIYQLRIIHSSTIINTILGNTDTALKIDNNARSKPNVFKRIWRFYFEGFRDMTVGKTLWAIILAKLVIFFVILKIFFFPNILQRDYNSDEERADHVRESLTGKSTSNNI